MSFTLSTINSLKSIGELLTIEEEVDPHLEMASIHRQVFKDRGPAIFFKKVKNSPFPAASNIFGSEKRCNHIFKTTLPSVEHLVRAKANPQVLFRKPTTTLKMIPKAFNALPIPSFNQQILNQKTTVDQLPQIKCWPDDGGAFITLPQVFSMDPSQPSILTSNLGMYRIQLTGNDYVLNEEIGLHYQIHRGIGIHHTKALDLGKPLKVSIFIGGPIAHNVAAVMPLPEGLPETAFAGMLAGRNFRYFKKDGYLISSDADFVITGEIQPYTKPEGPFGDHLGYYSLTHDFPVLKVNQIYHQKDAVWPFTVVGRPPQEDSQFGKLIHKITKPAVESELPGVKALHAVDETGVHPLLLATASERYTPYQNIKKPQEILTSAHAILGFGQCSLAKYLMITDADLDVNNTQKYISHFLSVVDWKTDLHFQTETTMDTLDYSATGLNRGSKVVIATVNTQKCELRSDCPKLDLSVDFTNEKIIDSGVIAIQCEPFESYKKEVPRIQQFCKDISIQDLTGIKLIVICDDADFTSKDYANFLWVTFTRSNPSHDVYGIGEKIEFKHWGCSGPLVIDARVKPHMAPGLIEDESSELKAKAIISYASKNV